MVREEEGAGRGPDPVGGDDEVSVQVARRRGDAGRGLPARRNRGHLGAEGDDPVGHAGRQRVDHGRARHQDDRVAEPVRHHLPGGAPHQPPAVGPPHAHLLRHGMRAELVAGADRVERAQPVGRQPEPGANRLKRRRPLEGRDLPAGRAQPGGRREPADPAPDHHRTSTRHRMPHSAGYHYYGQ